MSDLMTGTFQMKGQPVNLQLRSRQTSGQLPVKLQKGDRSL